MHIIKYITPFPFLFFGCHKQQKHEMNRPQQNVVKKCINKYAVLVKFQLMPGASSSNSATTPIWISPPTSLAIVIRLASSTAWHIVPTKCTIAYISFSTLQVPSYWFWFHHHFLIWIDQISHKKPAIATAANESELHIVGGMWWLNNDGHGHGQEEDEDGDWKSSHWDGEEKLERCPGPSGESWRGRLKGCMNYKCKDGVLVNLEVFN